MTDSQSGTNRESGVRRDSRVSGVFGVSRGKPPRLACALGRAVAGIAGAALLISGSDCSFFENVGSSERMVTTPVSPASQQPAAGQRAGAMPHRAGTSPPVGPLAGISPGSREGPVGPGTSLEPAGARNRSMPGQEYPQSSNASPASGQSPSADMMFADADPFAAPPASNVNVFGELDGQGPSVFTVGGKAGFSQHTYVDEGYDADPHLSPDGKLLLFSSTRHSMHPDLYMQKVDGLAVTQITSDPGDDAFPTFNSDQSRIAFASNRAGNWDIYVMDVDGNNVEQVTRTLSQDIHPTFSPDGSKLAYCSLGSRSGQWELWVVELKTLERKMIGYGLFPEWNPQADRDVIAFQRARQRGTRWFSAWTLQLIDGEAKNVTEIAFSTNAAIVAPSWNADGTKLAFATIIDPTAADPGQTGAAPQAGRQSKGTSQDIWTVNADGTDRKRLTDGRGVNATPTWGPDGKVYFVSDRGGAESIWSTAGQGKTMTATGTATGGQPAIARRSKEKSPPARSETAEEKPSETASTPTDPFEPK